MLGKRKDDCLSEHSHLNPAFLLLTFFILMITLSPASHAVRITFQEGVDGYTGTADNSIYSGQTGNSNGAGQSIIVGRTFTGLLRRGLISFDLSSLPIGITILNATLEMNVSFGQGGSRAFTAHRLLKDWGEGLVDTKGSGDDREGQGAPAGDGDATWNSNHHNQSTWDTAGGDFSVTASGSGTVNTGTIRINGAGMRDDIQAWVDGTATNNGWIIIGVENTNGTAKRIRSSESSSNRPILIIDYSDFPVDTPTPTPTETPAETPTPTFTVTPGIETPTPTLSPTPAPTRSADLNNDGTIDEKDLLLFYGQWHQAVQ